MNQKEYKIQLQSYIKNIKKALNENYLSIFAGAGISKDSKLPLYKDLMNRIKNHLNTKEKDYRILAEIFYNQYGENYYYQILNEMIPSDCSPNDKHKAIVNLNLKNLITTNWDNLFEKAISETGKYYDIISNDEDIASSRGFSKLIKMHGSLEYNNIVFKDSDYLMYSENFPLIENYIKGIFSTDIVVIMGYSLSDENVKQIISWVNSKAVNIKPIYLLKIDSQFDYQEFDFYKKRNVYVLYWSNDLSSFIIKIKDEVDIDKLTLRDINERFERLKQITDKYEYIIPDSFVDIVKKLFGLYGGYNDIIYMPHTGITIYNDKLLRIYQKMYYNPKTNKILNDYIYNFSNKTQAKIIIRLDGNILLNDGIGKYNFIKMNVENYFISLNYQVLEDKIKNITKSNQQDDTIELKKAFLLYQNRQFIESYHTLKRVSNSAFKNKNYIIWFISEFNRKNFVFDNPFGEDFKERSKEIESYFKETRKIDLQDLLFQLPKTDKEILKPIANIESFLDKYLIKVMKLNCEIQKDYEIHKEGGFSINNNINQILEIFTQVQLLINNYYLTLEYSQFINDFYIKLLEAIIMFFGEIAIKEKKIKHDEILKIEFDETIYYCIIRFYNYKELQKILDNSFEENTIFIFKDYKFILEIFNNISDKFDNPQTYYARHFNIFLTFNAYVEIEQDIFDKIIYGFNNKMKEGIISLTEYESLNYFIVNQFKRNKKLDFNKIKDIIISYIDLFIYGKINFYHVFSLTHSMAFGNMFAILNDKNINCSLKDSKISIFLEEIRNVDINIQGTIAANFLVNIYNLLNKDRDTKKRIKDFLYSLLTEYKNKNKKRIDDYDYFLLSYMMIENKIGKLKKQDINIDMDKYIKENYNIKDLDLSDSGNKADIIKTLGIIQHIKNTWKS